MSTTADRKTFPPTPTREFRVTAAKRKVLTSLAEYFCLRPKDLAFIRKKCIPTETDVRGLRFTLARLHAEGLVHRERYFEPDRDSGGLTYVYGLSDKGISRHDDSSIGARPKTFDEHSARTLDHELEISQFHMHLKRFLEESALQLFWQQADLKTDTIHPDALFAITDPKRPAGSDTSHFFLEIERSKIGNYKNGEPSILRKLGKFYEYYDSTACEKEWNFRQFRVIVVQPSDAKRGNLLQALRSQHSHRMFWLTTEFHYKQDIGGEIFKTPKDHLDKTYSFKCL